MIRRLLVLLSTLGWLGCASMPWASRCGSATCVSDERGVFTCGDPIQYPCPRTDCSKRAQATWPVCTEVPEETCRALKPITRCWDPANPRADHCYLARGVDNCVQLWSYRRGRIE